MGIIRDYFRRKRRKKTKGLRPQQGIRLRQRGARQGIARLAAAVILTVLLVVPLHWFWYSGISNLAASAPLTTELSHLIVKLDPAQPVILGHNELVQRPGPSSAEADHIELSARAGIATATIRNMAEQRNLFLEYRDGAGHSAARWEIRAYDSLRIRGAHLRFIAVSEDILEFELERAGKTVSYRLDARGSRSDMVRVDGQPARICTSSGFSSLAWMRRNSERTAVLLGGRLDCMVDGVFHVSLPDIEWQSLALKFADGRFFLTPQAAKASELSIASFAREDGEKVDGFGQISYPLHATNDQPLSRIIVGKTGYQVSFPAGKNGSTIVFRPQSKSHVFRLDPAVIVPPGDCPEGFPGIPAARSGVERCMERPSTVLDRGNGADILSTINGNEVLVRRAFALIGFSAILFMLSWPLYRLVSLSWKSGSTHYVLPEIGELLWPLLTIGLVLGIAGAPDFASYFLGEQISLTDGLLMTVACFFVLSLVVVCRNGLNLAFCLGMLAIVSLVASGTLVLFSLAIDGDTTHWLSFIAKHKLLFLDPLVVAMAIVLTLPIALAGSIIKSFILSQSIGSRIARSFGALIPIAAIGAWFFAGNEEGLGGFQPVEFAKIAIVVILAMLLVGLNNSMDSLRSRSYRWFIGSAIVVLAVFLGLLIWVPVLKNDYSPALITGLVMVVMFFGFMPMWVYEWLRDVLDRRERIYRIPRSIRYPVSSLWRGTAIAVLVTGISIVVLAAVPFTFNILNWTLTGQFSLSGNVEDQLNSYRQMRLSGGLGTISRRFYAFYDLSHDPEDRKNENGEKRFIVLDRDAGLQSLRSKIAIANAPCGFHRLGIEQSEVGQKMMAAAKTWTGGGCKDLPLNYDPGRTGSDKEPENIGADLPTGSADAKASWQNDDESNSTPYFVEDLISVPVVQNDFIGAYVAARFGIASALMVSILQALVIVFCVFLFFAVKPPKTVGTAEFLARQFLRMALVGVTALFFLHWAIAWSNVLGLLPIMGQPMTFIAAATSHHLFMALPSIMIIILAARYSHNPVMISQRKPPRRHFASILGVKKWPLVWSGKNAS